MVPIRDGHSAQHVGDALITTFTGLPLPLRRTLTWDEGNEMFHHQRIGHATGLSIYFADPHSPGSAAATRTSTAFSGSTSPKDSTSTPPQTNGSKRSLMNSTNVLEPASETAARANLWQHGAATYYSLIRDVR